MKMMIKLNNINPFNNQHWSGYQPIGQAPISSTDKGITPGLDGVDWAPPRRLTKHEIGSNRVGIRLSPYTDFMESVDSDPDNLGLYLANELNSFDLVYLHMIGPRMTGDDQVPHKLLPIRKAFNNTFISRCWELRGFDCVWALVFGESRLAEAIWAWYSS